MTFREGGTFRSERRPGNDDEPLVWSGEFLEVVENERLSFTLRCHVPAGLQTCLGSWAPPAGAGPWTIRVVLTPQDEQTRIDAECAGVSESSLPQVKRELGEFLDLVAYQCWFDVTTARVRTQLAIAQIQSDLLPEHVSQEMSEENLMQFTELVDPFGPVLVDGTANLKPLVAAFIDDYPQSSESVAAVYRVQSRYGTSHPLHSRRALASCLFTLIDRNSTAAVREGVGTLLKVIPDELSSGRLPDAREESDEKRHGPVWSETSGLLGQLFDDETGTAGSRINPGCADQIDGVAAAVVDTFALSPLDTQNGIIPQLLLTLMARADMGQPDVASTLFRHWLPYVDSNELQRLLDFFLVERQDVDIRIALEEAANAVRARIKKGLPPFPVDGLRWRYFGTILKRNVIDRIKRMFGRSRR